MKLTSWSHIGSPLCRPIINNAGKDITHWFKPNGEVCVILNIWKAPSNPMTLNRLKPMSIHCRMSMLHMFRKGDSFTYHRIPLVRIGPRILINLGGWMKSIQLENYQRRPVISEYLIR
jgi:hypothetical protein